MLSMLLFFCLHLFFVYKYSCRGNQTTQQEVDTYLHMYEMPFEQRLWVRNEGAILSNTIDGFAFCSTHPLVLPPPPSPSSASNTTHYFLLFSTRRFHWLFSWQFRPQFSQLRRFSAAVPKINRNFEMHVGIQNLEMIFPIADHLVTSVECTYTSPIFFSPVWVLRFVSAISPILLNFR